MKRILEILEEIRPEFDFADSTDFIGDGYLDSFDVFELVTQLEETFGIMIDGMDILPENFMSVSTIADLVKKSGGMIKDK